MGEGIRPTGHQLSGPFPENAGLSALSSVESRKRGRQRSEGTNSRPRLSSIEPPTRNITTHGRPADSPKLRDSNPSVVVVPGLGLFGFGKNKKEARITTEFFINAIHVMAGANALEDGEVSHPLPQARHAEQSQQFTQFHNYVALPRSEAFRIEYWALEEAKLQRMPAEAEFSRKIALVIGGASGIGREVALLLARKGAHVVVADFDQQGAKKVADEAGAIASPEFVAHVRVDLSSAASLAEAASFTISQFGGIDIVVNTAAIYPVPGADGELADAQWAQTFLVNVTGNYLLARQTEWIFKDQGLPAAMVLTSSANAVVPKKGSEAYDTSKTALNHLIRELVDQARPACAREWNCARDCGRRFQPCFLAIA